MSIDIPLGDRVFLEGMRFYGYHGVNPEERLLGQHFLVDVSISADLHSAGLSDDLRDTISYSEVYRLVRELFEGEPKNLIETVAEAIATCLLSTYPRAQNVMVAIRKPEAPIRDSFVDAAGVTIVRSRETSSDA